MVVQKGGGFPKINAADIAKRFGSNQREGSSSYKDKRFWNISKDKANQGFAVIRFLPDKQLDQMPYKEILTYNIEANGVKFWGLSRETFREADPVADWAKEQDPKLIEKFGMKPKTRWISNILVIEDAVTENIGQVRLLDFSYQVFKILKEKARPTVARRAPLYYWLFDEGANFELALGKDEKNGRPSWESSQFLQPEDISVTLKALRLTPDDVLEQLNDLGEVVAAMPCPSYEERQKDFERFLKRAGLETETFQGARFDKADAAKVNGAKEQAKKEDEQDELPGEKVEKVERKVEEKPSADVKSDIKDRIKAGLKGKGSFAEDL